MQVHKRLGKCYGNVKCQEFFVQLVFTVSIQIQGRTFHHFGSYSHMRFALNHTAQEHDPYMKNKTHFHKEGNITILSPSFLTMKATILNMEMRTMETHSEEW